MGVAAVGTFASASSDLDTFIDLGEKGVKVSDEALRVVALSNQSSGSASLELALVDVSGTERVCIARFGATATVGSGRAGNDGASGDYVCSVSFAEGGSSKFDLLGDGGDRSGTGSRWRWMLGCTALTTVTSLDVYVASSEKV